MSEYRMLSDKLDEVVRAIRDLTFYVQIGFWAIIIAIVFTQCDPPKDTPVQKAFYWVKGKFSKNPNDQIKPDSLDSEKVNDSLTRYYREKYNF
jgi:hypothetical protein